MESVTTRTASGGFKTNEGTIHVSKPFRSKTSKKLFGVITFTPRMSAFDTNNASSGANEFRGFFSLFWISMFIFTVQTYVSSFERNGYPLSMAFALMFSRDAITLALSDAVLVASTALCVPFAIALRNGWIRYYWTGAVLQHLFQTLVLFSAITWTFNRQWPWVQSGFLTLHSLVLIMKMHSYMSVNGHLQYINVQASDILTKLRDATLPHGGWDFALSTAKARRAELDAATAQESTDEFTPAATPSGVSDGTRTSIVDAEMATALRRRLLAASAGKREDLHPEDARFTREKVDSVLDPLGSHTLLDHPDEIISNLAREHSDLEAELTSRGPEHIRWPDNITLKFFAVYQLIPTLVYELEYPRTDRIRPLYLFEKTVATFGTFALLYTVTESFILPLTPTPEQSFFRSLLDLALPFMIAYLLLFFIIFECICNAFAELSFFADRQFYEDWVSPWNSTSWDEFSRKWNKPVHSFLLRHVYGPTIANYKVSRTSAMVVTFLLSAAAHELVMVVVTHKIRMYLFVMQLCQIPLIALSRLPKIKQNKLMGNVVFWIGLYAGFPLLCVAYVAY